MYIVYIYVYCIYIYMYIIYMYIINICIFCIYMYIIYMYIIYICIFYICIFYICILYCLRSALSPKCPSPCVPCTLLDLCGSSHTNAQSTDAPSCFRSRNGLGNVGLNEMQNGICRHMNKSTNTPPNLRCPSADYTFDAFGKFNWHGNFHP